MHHIVHKLGMTLLVLQSTIQTAVLQKRWEERVFKSLANNVPLPMALITIIAGYLPYPKATVIRYYNNVDFKYQPIDGSTLFYFSTSRGILECTRFSYNPSKQHPLLRANLLPLPLPVTYAFAEKLQKEPTLIEPCLVAAEASSVQHTSNQSLEPCNGISSQTLEILIHLLSIPLVHSHPEKTERASPFILDPVLTFKDWATAITTLYQKTQKIVRANPVTSISPHEHSLMQKFIDTYKEFGYQKVDLLQRQNENSLLFCHEDACSPHFWSSGNPNGCAS